MKPTNITHLLNDFALGGVTKNLEIYQKPDIATQFDSTIMEVDPEWSIAPKLNTDIIFVHFPPSWRNMAFLYSLRGRNPDCDIIWMEHSYNREWEAIHVPVKSRFRTMLGCAVSLFDEVVCVSEAQATWLGEVTRIDAGAFHVINPWSSLEGLEQIPSPRFAASRSLTIGAYGRFSESKGFAELIEAVKQIDKSANIYLNIGGYGEQEADLRKLAHGYANIRFCGKIDALPDFLSLCDVIAIPSHFESFGLVAAEAKMAARPILVAPVGGLPEQVGNSGIVVDCSDYKSLADVLGNIRQLPLAEMAEYGRKDALASESRRFSALLTFLRQIARRRCLVSSGTVPILGRRPFPTNMSAGQ